MTWLGLLGAVITFVAGCLANLHPGFLWLAAIGLAANWLGDSMDGSLARHRGVERPQYGFFLDHTVDGFAMVFIALGIGFSPMAHLWCALLTLVGYYIMTVVSLTICLATGVFQISFGRIGPTEVRLGIAGCAIAAVLLPIAHFDLFGLPFTIYDLALIAFAAGLVLTAVLQAIATAQQLAVTDPPYPRKRR